MQLDFAQNICKDFKPWNNELGMIVKTKICIMKVLQGYGHMRTMIADFRN
jgi:hypothetical protein